MLKGRTPLNIRVLKTLNDFNQCEYLQKQVWGLEDLGIKPTHFFVASSHSGGLVLGAFAGNNLIGFLNGFPAYLPNKAPHLPGVGLGFHSDMMAVLPEYRGQGIGRALKWRQREWCLARNIPWIAWTFDPLQRKNAHLNLEHLGVTVSEYRVNEYGELGGSLNADLPSDRLLAYWNLEADRVQRLAQGIKDDVNHRASYALRSINNKPAELKLELGSQYIAVDLPDSLNDLLKNDATLALEWRLAVREVLQHYLGAGYTIKRFLNTAYILSKS